MRNLARQTQIAYVTQVARFSQYFGKSPEWLGPEEIPRYQVYLVEEKQVSWSLFSQTVCALRFLYRLTLRKEWAIEHILFPRREKKLPVALSLSEVARFSQAIPYLKHRALLMTAYAAGLRTSEVVHLRVADIDSQRMVIHVRQGKGRKDRYVMLSSKLLELLRVYWKVVRPREWLFACDNAKVYHYHITPLLLNDRSMHVEEVLAGYINRWGNILIDGEGSGAVLRCSSHSRGAETEYS